MNAAAIFIIREGQQFGPFDVQTIKDLVAAGGAALSDLAWAQGQPEWQPLHQVLGVPPPIPKTPAKKQAVTKASSTGYGWKTVMVIVGVLGAMIWFGSYMEDQNARSPERQARNAELSAFSMATQSIITKLKSPSTAKFCTSREASIEKLNDGGYDVRGYVDSQNGFGAMIRANWRVVMKPEGGKWFATYEKLGDQTSGISPETKAKRAEKE